MGNRPHLVVALGLLLALSLLAANYRYSLTHETQFTASGTRKGDTNSFGAWTPATDGGPWNGGYLLGTTGDGAWDNAQAYHIIAMKLDSYDPTSISGTAATTAAGSGVNTMSAWGVPSENNCMGGNPSLSCSGGLAPWSHRGKIYFPIQAQYDGPNFGNNRQAIIVSPDRMLHWCNWANYQAYGNTCTPTNWSATGDVITADVMTYNGLSKQAVQWSKGDYVFGNEMGRLSVIEWGQDAAGGAAVPAGVDSRIDTTYTYAISMSRLNTPGTLSQMYCHRFLTSVDPIDPAVYGHRNGGTWDPIWTNSTPMDMGGFDLTDGFGHSEIYSPDAKKFIMRYSAGGTNSTILTADLPWGPWTVLATPSGGLTPTDSQYVGWIPPTYASLGGGWFRISNVWNGGNGTGPLYVPGFQEWTFSAVNSSRVSGKGSVRNGVVR